MRHITEHLTAKFVYSAAFYSEFGGQLGDEILSGGNPLKVNAPVNPGAFCCLPTERRWCSVRQIKLHVAATIDHRFVLAVAVGLVSVLGIVLLLKK